MPSREFDDLMSGSAIHHDPELCRLLEEADGLPHAVLFAIDFHRNKMLYVSHRIETLFGYPVSKVNHEGIQFIIAITLPEDYPKLVDSQATYAFQSKAQGFDPRSLVIHKYEWTALKKNNQHIDVTCLNVPLTFTENRQIELTIGFILATSEYTELVQNQCTTFLKKIKLRHNEIAVVAKEQMSLPGAQKNSPHVSPRELQVLRLLAQGLSTKEIGSKLGISPHTTESHRKHLLEKFDAKNAAELVMKANRIYGLDT